MLAVLFFLLIFPLLLFKRLFIEEEDLKLCPGPASVPLDDYPRTTYTGRLISHRTLFLAVSPEAGGPS